MFTRIQMIIENEKLVSVSCYKNGLPYGIPRNFKNTDYLELLDEVIENGDKNFLQGETIVDDLQKDIDAKKGGL